MKMKGILAILILICMAIVTPLYAAEFPDRPVNLMVGYSTGGIGDLQLRAIASASEPFLGQPITPINKPGAVGTVMMALLKEAKPDGYTAGIIPGSLTVTPYLQSVPFELKDFTYLVGLSTFLESLNVQAESPWKTAKDLVEYAKQNPGKVRIGTSGITSSVAYMQKVIFDHFGAKFIFVPFGGEGEVITALLGGHIEGAALIGVNLQYVRSGKFRMLAIGTTERLQEFPDVPTCQELGVDFVAMSYVGIVGPKNLPEPITKKLIDSFKKGREDKSFTEFMKKTGLIPRYETGKDFETRIMENYEKTGKIIKK
jgi:tripartite-type tricarboxylate transporter receptor subunit TctC